MGIFQPAMSVYQRVYPLLPFFLGLEKKNMFSVTSVLAGCKASISAAGSLQESKSFLAFHGAGRGGKVTCFDMFFVFFFGSSNG